MTSVECEKSRYEIRSLGLLRQLTSCQCDEVQPVCGQCEKSKRACAFTFGKKKNHVGLKFVNMRVVDSVASKTSVRAGTIAPGDRISSHSNTATSRPRIVLALRETRNSEVGHGVFQKFNIVPTYTAKEERCVADELESRRLSTDMLGSEVRQWAFDSSNSARAEAFVTEELLDDIPIRPKHHNAIDVALGCLIHSASAYLDRTEENTGRSCSLNIRALASIRASLLPGQSIKVQEDTLVAIHVLTLAEVHSTYPCA